jgi:predicted dehydrogenase
MATALKIGIIGAGWPGIAHARGYREAGGFKIVSVADRIPERRQTLASEFAIASQFSTWEELLKSAPLDAVSICLPNHLHAPCAIAAMRAGIHVLCEKPPAHNLRDARRIESASRKYKRVVLYGFQRLFGGAELSTRQTIQKGYAGEVYHVRASWMRTRGIPIGTGWFTDRAQSGGGALVDLGVHMLALAWKLLSSPQPQSIFAVTHRKFESQVPANLKFDVEDFASALVRFENGSTLDLSTSWSINQAPSQQGMICRVYGTEGGIDVYTAAGAVLHRGFDAKGNARSSPLKPPRVTAHAALMRHFRECITGKTSPIVGVAEGVTIMRMIQSMYRSAASGKSVAAK